ncbi:MAG: hypothetical protein V4463_12235, partial [Pseudomonadota bacterium]
LRIGQIVQRNRRRAAAAPSMHQFVLGDGVEPGIDAAFPAKLAEAFEGPKNRRVGGATLRTSTAPAWRRGAGNKLNKIKYLQKYPVTSRKYSVKVETDLDGSE